MVLDFLLQKLSRTTNILDASFGLEREGLRITSRGKIASSDHPQVLGSRSFHPYIQTDFSEQQMECITPVSQSTTEARRRLMAIFDVAQSSLDKDQYIWPLSMPPHAKEEDFQIAKLEDPAALSYRKKISRSYGVLRQAISGIHYNFGLGDDLIQKLFELSDEEDKINFINLLYMKLARQYLRYQWLLTYLFSASPLAEKGFYENGPQKIVRGLRSSQAYGYINKKSVQVSYDSLEAYIDSLEKAIASKELSREREFYSAVRLRGSQHSRDYLTKGITYLELRNFDIDPFDDLGISQKTLDSVHLILLALLWLDDSKSDHQYLEDAKTLNEEVALSDPLEKLPHPAKAAELMEAMTALIEHFQLPDYYRELIQAMAEAISDPKLTIAGKLSTQITDHSLAAFGLSRAQKIHLQSTSAPYALAGYESMELSTQMIMFDAIQKGINLEILDENDQFLKLWHKKHLEYLKNGNMSSKDSYIVPLAMANKTVTKKILHQAGFPTPKGQEFAKKQEALNYYPQLTDSPMVVKPKSTNFGLGISIFPKPSSQSDYEKALDIAFAEDSHVLVEEYISGTEYRFFILDGKCEAVLLRLAANVVGDGIHTIKELVEIKNQNPLRGRDHRSPLEKIQLGKIEKLMLAQEGYTENSLLEKGKQVFLRQNSNISTGGDSVDVTDQMDPSYKKLAAQMAETMGAWVCGVDLIIPNIQQKASLKEPNCHCIEVNFNPSMYMHTYCQEGPGQVITPKILQALFPEVPIYKED
ncbi:bifunctional glutamate--cysteine ligase GshA/glutathione synthetase GshB [Streptococcus didelphis]|uniref:bifunctional glutamate--cysteine ligase GshA/glutathione synthetase GshB n=1 Tax=Streptococcus didelphis TaxID=102886 RepID=UPI0003627E03|nr:bifunctional glutamate--cysteine ligase GshA/glutathione synthetase GshB [Streptococcus didelphis]